MLISFCILSLSLLFSFQNCSKLSSGHNLNSVSSFYSLKAGRPCNEFGLGIADESSYTFYTLDKGTPSNSCQKNTLTLACQDGIFYRPSTTKIYTQCTDFKEESKTQPISCSQAGQTVNLGLAGTFFNSPVVSYNKDCSQFRVNRICQSNGLFENGPPHSRCQSELTPFTNKVDHKNCTDYNLNIKHGDTHIFYSTATVTGSNTCAKQQMKIACNDGVFINPSGVKLYTSCTNSQNKSCNENGVLVADGAWSSSTFYAVSKVPIGHQCPKPIARFCSNGTLLDGSVMGDNGNHRFTSCGSEDPKSCYVPNEPNVPNGGNHIFYSVSTSTNCNSFKATLACSNGKFTNNNSYPFSTCSASGSGTGTGTGTTKNSHQRNIDMLCSEIMDDSSREKTCSEFLYELATGKDVSYQLIFSSYDEYSSDITSFCSSLSKKINDKIPGCSSSIKTYLESTVDSSIKSTTTPTITPTPEPTTPKKAGGEPSHS